MNMKTYIADLKENPVPISWMTLVSGGLLTCFIAFVAGVFIVAFLTFLFVAFESVCYAFATIIALCFSEKNSNKKFFATLLIVNVALILLLWRLAVL